jgi:hypothetical protein
MKAVYCFLFFLVGCAQVPRPSTYPYTFQQKMQAADHWRVLANQVAEEVGTALKNEHSFLIDPVYVQNDDSTNSINAPCYDRTPFKNTTFAQAFHSFLITELTNQGIPISEDPNSRFHVCWTIQPIVHNAHRTKPYPSIAEAVLSIPPSVFVNIWGGIEAGSLPHSEIIITTTITDRGAIRSRNADIFYINDMDWSHYWSRSRPDAPQRTYALVGCQPRDLCRD